jgi:hypothetical protein
MTTVTKLTDDEFIARFEACTLPTDLFPHREHIRLAWLYLRRDSLPDALARVTGGIRRFAAAKGAPDRYHETITVAFVLLIADRVAKAAPDQTWDEFAAANPDLFDWKSGSIRPYYKPETLASDLARRHFLFPDAAARSALA